MIILLKTVCWISSNKIFEKFFHTDGHNRLVRKPRREIKVQREFFVSSAVFLDLKKAFDLVVSESLQITDWQNLETLLKLLQSYYSNKHSTFIRVTKLSTKTIVSGVIFINDLNNSITVKNMILLMMQF